MLRYLILLITVIAIGAWLMLNPGLVEIHVANVTFATQLWTFLLLILVAIILCKLIWQILKLPSRWRQHRHKRADKQMYQNITKQLDLLSQGQLNKIAGMKKYQTHIANHVLVLLSKALQGDLAAKAVSESVLAHENQESLIHLVAGLGLAYQGEFESAQESFRLVLVTQPRHSLALTLLAHSYYQNAQWALLYDLLIQYRRYLPATIVEAYEDDAAYEYLLSLMDDVSGFETVWRKLPYNAKHSLHFMDLRIEHLLAVKEYKLAKTCIEKGLSEHWHDDWVSQYCTIPTIEPQKCIKQLLAWLKNEPRNIVIFSALAKTHLEAGLTERAGTYFEAAFSQHASVKEGLALLAFYQNHQPEKVSQLIPHITRLIS
jgi:uncharacterized protein HemY